VEKKRARSEKMLVPNTAEGTFILECIKKWALPEWRVQLRGRHSNRKELLGKSYRPGTQNDVPVELSETIGVYFQKKNENKYKYW
jgi:hypothetical protein